MRSAAWSLAVLGALTALLSPGRSDCLGDCRACGPLEHPARLEALSTMVCYLECSGYLNASFLWELCRRAGRRLPSAAPGGSDASQEERAARDGEAAWGGGEVRFDSLLLGSQEEEEEEERLEGAEQLSLGGGVRMPRGEADGEGGGDGVSVSKRFGGFLRGRQGYRKLIGAPPGARPLQKRYGGFIGVRKSARKWNSQKRVNQLLRQYLGMRGGRGGGARYVGVPMATLRRSSTNL